MSYFEVEVAAVTTLNIPPPSSLTDSQGPPVSRQPLPVARGSVKNSNSETFACQYAYGYWLEADTLCGCGQRNDIWRISADRD
uniref:Uncharacterized protein n=1 Tax=Romanomermis culicivorax TaxID=13658 RepID=A0A915I0S1_ROMCU